MANFPFFGSPYHNYYYNYYQRYHNHEKSEISNSPKLVSNVHVAKEEKHENRSSTTTSFGPVQFHFDALSNLEEPILEIVGIQLYLDDLIILGLLFFLYQEGVKDEILFISLVLLLLS